MNGIPGLRKELNQMGLMNPTSKAGASDKPTAQDVEFVTDYGH